MTKVKGLYQANQLFFLFWIAFAATMLNISVGLGLFLFMGIVLVFVLSIYVYKIDSINYLEKILSYTEKTEYQMKVKLEQERLRREQLQKEQKVRQEQMEAEAFVMQIEQEKERQRLEQERQDKLLTQAEALMVDKGMSQTDIEEALAVKRTQFAEERQQSAAQAAVAQESKPKVEPVWTEETSYQAPPRVESIGRDFELNRHGTWINYVIIIGGLLSMIIFYSILSGLFGLPPLASGAFVSVLLVLFIINLLYYLPTLLYHSSVAGKMGVFVLNMFFGFTLILWVLLFMFVLSQNKSHAYQQEVLHHQRRQ